ncbi:pectinesterase/pectinesterase inhibitor 41 [Spatholobus suberectus]|nr:pectinesterase/pectinesterase inhibitor 41 [Spatholobus suberectus]
MKNGLSSPLTDDTKLHSVSLYLFTKAWVPPKKISTSWQHHGGIQNDRLPLKMSNKVRAIYDSAKGHEKKLLQSLDDNESVVVSDIVVVSKDGSRNFTTINDAIATAPNNPAATDGYFIIFITEAVVAQGFVTMNVTFRNTAGPRYQDTLYTHSLRQFYRECEIYGTVEFMFGNTAVVMQNCNMLLASP